MSDDTPTRRRPVSYLRSGFYSKSPAVIPPDSPVATVLAERRTALIDDLGGIEACSTAQLALVDLVVASWAQLDRGTTMSAGSRSPAPPPWLSAMVRVG